MITDELIKAEGLIQHPHIPHLYEWPKYSDEEGKAYLSNLGAWGEPLKKGMVHFWYMADKWQFYVNLPADLVADVKFTDSFILNHKVRYKKDYENGNL